MAKIEARVGKLKKTGGTKSVLAGKQKVNKKIEVIEKELISSINQIIVLECLDNAGMM
ncbi:MAG TPA: hypothetical protein VH396_02980 [Chitinophagaceae bacterium]